jgi:pimeloyl-ACP methyl ester carboxylesterase
MPGEILVLHGLAMSGRAMLDKLGPIASLLESLDYELVAPDAPYRLSALELRGIVRWARARYQQHDVGRPSPSAEERGQDFGHFDWLRSETNPNTGERRYAGLEDSLTALTTLCKQRRFSGVVGFSQGAALAIIWLALARAGDPRFELPRFALFFSGFTPVFLGPPEIDYPLTISTRTLALRGEHDPLFPGDLRPRDAASLVPLDSAFAPERHRSIVVPELAHEVPTDPNILETIRDFVEA